MRSPIKTAIIGVGRWGKNVARELYNSSELIGYAARTNAHDTWAAEAIPNAKRMSISEICADPSIEAVAITTPIATHYQIARQCLEAEKHVFVEKPLAMTFEEAKVLEQKAYEKKRILAVGYIFLYHPAFQKIQELTKAKSIQRTTLNWRKYGTFTEQIEFNLLTHHLAMALHLYGMPTSGHLECIEKKESLCDHTKTELRYENHSLFSNINRISEGKSHAMHVELTDSSSYTWEENSVSFTRDKQAAEIVYKADAQPLTLEIQAFLGAISGNGAPLITDGSFGVRVLQLHEMLQKNLR